MSDKTEAEKALEKIAATSGIRNVSEMVELPPKIEEGLRHYKQIFANMSAKNRRESMTEQEIEYPSKRKTRAENAPVENDEPVPLLPNLDGNARHVIACIRVHKRTPPNDGIKGEIPPSSTLEFVARRWGDGIYDFEGLNQDQTVLRRHTNVKISMGHMPTAEFPPRESAKLPLTMQSADNDLADKLLERQDARFEKDQQRSKELAESIVAATQRLSSDYATMVREDARTRSERDREYHRSQSEQQSHFFQALLASMQTMHSQSMEMQRESFQQTIQMMIVNHQQAMQQNNPMTFLNLFKEGMRLASETSGGEQSDPVTGVLTAGVEGMKQIKEMMALQSLSSAPDPAKLGAGQSATKPFSKPLTSRREDSGKDKKPALSRTEITEIIRLKRLAATKGFDFGSLVKQAQTLVSNSPSNGAETAALEANSEQDSAEDSE